MGSNLILFTILFFSLNASFSSENHVDERIPPCLLLKKRIPQCWIRNVPAQIQELNELLEMPDCYEHIKSIIVFYLKFMDNNLRSSTPASQLLFSLVDNDIFIFNVLLFEKSGLTQEQIDETWSFYESLLRRYGRGNIIYSKSYTEIKEFQDKFFKLHGFEKYLVGSS